MSHEWAKKAVEAKLYSMRDVQKAEKQARAEVLASIHAWYDKLFHTWKKVDWGLPPLPGSDRALMTALLKEGPKPAASDLEALLREAELKGLKLAHNPEKCSVFWDCPAASRIAYLEKARIISGGK